MRLIKDLNLDVPTSQATLLCPLSRPPLSYLAVHQLLLCSPVKSLLFQPHNKLIKMLYFNMV